MIKNLVIVESPAKAKTIEKFLGKDFTVKSCFGHIRDLPKGNNAIDVKNGFKPMYEVSPDKIKVVDDLKKLASKTTTVWLATDEDREGEAISWHLTEVLNLDNKKTKRIVFHEITKNAILEAIKNPRTIDLNLVNGQQARRILDRLVGFELSPILWTKIKSGLSAGRVQSVSVRLVVERERDINKFQTKASFKIQAEFFSPASKKFRADLITKPDQIDNVRKVLENCINQEFTVNSVDTKPGKKSPSAPFITSTLQQEASRKLGYSVAKTMLLAQHLYERGFITYMRTDSTNLAESAITSCSNEIIRLFGKKYLENRKYRPKSTMAQEAHEAIRPTDFSLSSMNSGDDKEIDASHNRLYELIWKRTIASQMSDAIIEKTVASITTKKPVYDFEAIGEVLKFDGFLKVYREDLDDDETENNESSLLPELYTGDKLQLIQMVATEKYTRPSARYTEASLVKKLEELGIGRPSTYAPTISTIQKRGYVIKEDRDGVSRNYRVLTLKNKKIIEKTETEITGKEKSKLFPTDIGSIVNDFLIQNFKDIMDFSFTASVEKQFDEIAMGEKNWSDMLADFYKPFHKQVEGTKVNVDRSDLKGARVLGKDPKSGKEVSVRLGKFGPIVQIGSNAKDATEKPLYSSLRKGQSIETISLADAMELFKLPRTVGKFEEMDVIVNIGRFGPYVKLGSDFFSLNKVDDPYTVSYDRAIETIKEKRLAKANKIIREFEKENLKVLNGKWGPYLTDGKNNYKIPKDKTAEALVLEDCLQIIEDSKNKPEKNSVNKK